jgi:hypothetical protein
MQKQQTPENRIVLVSYKQLILELHVNEAVNYRINEHLFAFPKFFDKMWVSSNQRNPTIRR